MRAARRVRSSRGRCLEGGENAEYVRQPEDAGQHATSTLGDEESYGDGFERHLACLEDVREDDDHEHAAEEEREVVVDRQDEGETGTEGARHVVEQRTTGCTLTSLVCPFFCCFPHDHQLGAPLLEPYPRSSDGRGDSHGLECERREVFALVRVEEEGHGCPHLGDRRGKTVLLRVEGEGHVLDDELTRPGRDHDDHRKRRYLQPELPRSQEAKPPTVGHVTGQVSGLRSGSGDESCAREVGAGARTSGDRGAPLEDDGHHTRRIETGLRLGRDRDGVQEDATHSQHHEDDDDRQMEVEVQEAACDGQAEEGEPLELRRAQHPISLAAGELGERPDRVRDDVPPGDEHRDAGTEKQADAWPQVCMGSGGVFGVWCDDDEEHTTHEEPEADAKPHHVAGSHAEWRKRHTCPECGKPEPRELRHLGYESDATVVEHDVGGRQGESDEEVPRLRPVTGLDERFDHSVDYLCGDPAELLVFGELLVLDHEELSHDHHDGESDEARCGVHEDHVPERVRVADHGLGGVEVRHEAEASAGATHGRHDDHLFHRDVQLEPDEYGEEEECGDGGPLLHDAELQHQERVHGTQQCARD